MNFFRLSRYLLDFIKVANKAFMEARSTSDLIKQRQSIVSNLETGYKYFQDISGNLQEGIKVCLPLI